MSPHSLKSLFDLSGKTALVTGASRGLGVPMCEALGEFGAKVLLVARKQGELDEAVEHLQSLGVQARAIAADVGKLTEPARIVSEIEAAGDRVDILVNNAGTSWGSNSEDLPVDAWNKLMAVNLTAPFLLAQAVAKTFMLPAGWGRIINIASVEGFLGHHPRMIGTLAYNTSKGGLINFTRALAAEWASKGVNVNAIAPGYFPSKLTGYILDKHGADIVHDTPRGVLGVDEDLKGATLLLASNAGAHIVGQVLTIDGGASII